MKRSARILFLPLLATGLLLGGCAKKPPSGAATLEFHSFDGGGPSYSVTIEDESVISCTSEHRYAKKNHKKLKRHWNDRSSMHQIRNWFMRSMQKRTGNFTHGRSRLKYPKRNRMQRRLKSFWIRHSLM